jgi:hypothetical protein
MTTDSSFQTSGSKQLTPDTRRLLSLALDAYLTGHERVAHDLTALASRLIELRCSPRFRAIAKEILERASSPGQDFATLLDPFDPAERACESLAGKGKSEPTAHAMANLDVKSPPDGQ